MINARDYSIRQMKTAWQLASFHLDDLTTEACLWRPASVGLHVHRPRDGVWRAYAEPASLQTVAWKPVAAAVAREIAALD